MPYTNGDGIEHDSRRCRRLHSTGRRIVRTDTRDTDDLDACPVCGDADETAQGERETDDGPTDAERDIAGYIEMGVCPWCDGDDGYEGDHVGQHASSAHPEEWTAYRDR